MTSTTMTIVCSIGWWLIPAEFRKDDDSLRTLGQSSQIVWPVKWLMGARIRAFTVKDHRTTSYDLWPLTLICQNEVMTCQKWLMTVWKWPFYTTDINCNRGRILHRLLPERNYVRYVRVFAIANPSVVCLSVKLVHLLRGLNLSAVFLHRCVSWPSGPPCKIIRRSPQQQGNSSVGDAKRKRDSKIERW